MEKRKNMTDTLMDGGLLHLGCKSVLNPQLSLFTIPPTDLSMSSYRIVPIQTYTTGINPMEFQVDSQEDYVDLSQSFFEIEFALKLANGDNIVQATRLWPTNNLAHTVQTDQCETQWYLDQSSDRYLSLQSIPGNIAQLQQR